MNAEEKFNSINTFIDAEISKGLNAKARDISYNISKKFGIESRSLSEIFDFLAEMPIIAYIKTRQLMKAAEVVLEGGSNQDAIKYTGYNDESSFIKAFSRAFSVSPGNFAKLENPQIQKPLTWNDITNSEQKTTTGKEPPSQMKFGIPIELYKKMQEAEGMQILYGFDDEASNVAYKTAQKFKVELADAFEFVDQLIIYHEGRRPFINDYDSWISTFGDIVDFYFKLKTVSFSRTVDLFTAITSERVKTLSEEDIENLSKNSYTLGDISFLNTDIYEESITEYGGISTSSNLDDGEDFFDMYAAYEWRDSYGNYD